MDKPELETMPMDSFRACMIAEGVEEADQETQLEAWQYLVDTGIVWKLQGRYGRTAMDLLRQGLLNPPANAGTVKDFWGNVIQFPKPTTQE